MAYSAVRPKVQDNVLPGNHSGYAGTHPLDDPSAFMPEYDRQRMGPLAFYNVVIRVTYAGCDDPY
jgi:hypothetical protein